MKQPIDWIRAVFFGAPLLAASSGRSWSRRCPMITHGRDTDTHDLYTFLSSSIALRPRDRRCSVLAGENVPMA